MNLLPIDAKPLTALPRLALLFALVLPAACTTTSTPAPPNFDFKSLRLDDGSNLSSDSDTQVRDVLYRIHDDWAGVPYRYGGMSVNGIDCSGLVHRAFREHFGLVLPRTTRAQVKTGRAVERDALRAGDLVFFKTQGGRSRHVGIYIEDARFLHASTSRGVRLSDLRNPYWAGNYWQARRLTQ